MNEEKTKKDKPTADSFEQAVIAARQSVGSLLALDKITSDGKITAAEFLRSFAIEKAFNKTPNTPDDVQGMYLKIEALAEGYIKSPKVIKEAKDKFTDFQKNNPDLEPKNGEININEIAMEKLNALYRTFPEDMKKTNEAIQKETFDAALSPTDVLGKIADKVINFTK